MSKLKFQMTNQVQNPNAKKYDLEERTSGFGEDAIEFAQNLSDNAVNRPLVSQFIRSATSVGANYREADGAESKKDFQHKLGICKKESKETLHWLQMLAKANPAKASDCRKLWKECHELVLILNHLLIDLKFDIFNLKLL